MIVKEASEKLEKFQVLLNEIRDDSLRVNAYLVQYDQFDELDDYGTKYNLEKLLEVADKIM